MYLVTRMRRDYERKCLPNGHAYTWDMALGDYSCELCRMVLALAPLRAVDQVSWMTAEHMAAGEARRLEPCR